VSIISVPYLEYHSERSLSHSMEIFAFFMLTGIFSTLLIPETKQKSLEDLSNEDQAEYITDS
jgi:PHS family inorganic phosphate transporter-like MFS transporter